MNNFLGIEFDEGASKRPSFPDPGPLPEELTRVPGFIGELTDFTLATGHSPNRVLAFSGALAMLAHLTGRSYSDTHGTRTNLYIVVLGDSGIGKDDPRKTNARLAQRVNFSESIAEAFASGEAIEDELYKCPSLLFQSDEVASFFGSMRGANKAAKSMSERIRRLFTSSSSEYILRGKANKEGPVRTIMNPHLCLFGTGVPEEFLDALTQHEIRDGLFGRCLILRATDQYSAQAAKGHVAFPPGIISVAEQLAARERAAIESGVFAISEVPETPEATALLEESRKSFMRLRKSLAEAGLVNARAQVVRMNEKTAKLALLWAISENAESPVITKAAVEWAVLFTVYVTKWMLFEGQFHSAEGGFGLLKSKALASLARHGGSLDRRGLIRSLGCDVGTLNRVIKAMLVAEEIDSPEQVDGKIVYSLRNE